MIAFKGFNQELKSVRGNDRNETCSFSPGITLEEKNSKTGQSGFHCCENPFECLAYYPMNGYNRFFMVEAAGDINEDRSERIACTKITLLKELDAKSLALYGMKYIVEHPDREKWRQNRGSVVVREDKAEAEKEEYIAIARGPEPRVKGPAGAILGLLVDRGKGIESAKLIVVSEQQAGKWLRITKDRKLEVYDEKEDG